MTGRAARFAPALACVALLALACSTTPPPGDNQPKPCAATKDCPTGQLCRQQVCVTLPCGGRCSNDEVCLDDNCKAGDGLACQADPSICPQAFVCSPGGTCARSCGADTECTQPGFKSCNTEAGFCGECTFDRDCTGDPAKGFCDKANARCVGCVDAKSCWVAGAAAGKYCDPASHACKAGCHASTDCGLGQRCQGGTAGVVGRCVECQPATEVNDCIVSPRVRCEPVSLACVECLADTDCASAQCNTSTHKCVECVKNEVCAKGYLCNPETNACVPGCAGGSGSANCPTANPALPVCDANRGDHGLCVACLKDADCPRALVCDLQAGTSPDGQGGTIKVPLCVDGCRSTQSGAPDDARCVDTSGAQPPAVDQWCDGARGSRGKCVQCRSTTDCPADKACDANTGLCRCKATGESCTAVNQCGYNANTHQCTVTGATCINKVHCRAGDKPISPVCSQAANGLVETGAQANCPSGSVTDWAFDLSGAKAARCVPAASKCP